MAPPSCQNIQASIVQHGERISGMELSTMVSASHTAPDKRLQLCRLIPRRRKSCQLTTVGELSVVTPWRDFSCITIRHQ
ncbi:hypothetical protein, variant [Phytophthora nicotianae INRA-310]|uniref:Uncharacterized protein n=1 Tax=Phytophthora nicotianae (strain INRA-310) TaxID=761204 RepID=W2QU40_PHYN3|nr:hypothetical protein PPTG_21748 [Phytophthora nicotianae INRA-310]XP_008898181.1 hypothetical protein, variant [Phytophthora nicotianae INRA-310]ETN16613.1 hypothetical protein PPTG_21748 [Phytophthora nicotianae INRA-310]ETN16614.1 hypothetical protein, variant [Phytophthora nicotianae INRA-310]